MLLSVRALRSRLAHWGDGYRVFLVNAGSIVGTQGVTSVLGFAYWWLAARRFSPEVVGFASAAISAMLLLGNMGMLGWGTVLIGELPRQAERRASLIATALMAAAAAGGVLGLAFAYLAPWLARDLGGLAATPAAAVLFAGGVAASSMVFVLDQAVIGLLRGSLQLWRNGLFAAAKLLLLLGLAIWFGDESGLGIYATWLLGNLVSTALLGGYALWRGLRLHEALPHWHWLRGLGRAAVAHHALNLTLQAPSQLMPLVVTALMSVRVNAYFYSAWMLASFVHVIPTSLATVLYAVGAGDRTLLAERMRTTLKLSVLIALAANVCLLLGADLILGVFGPVYATEAGWALRLLGLATFPLIVRGHAMAVFRLHDTVRQATVFTGVGGALELAFAAGGAWLGGLSGLCLGWLIAVSAEALLFAPVVHQTIFSRARQS